MRLIFCGTPAFAVPSLRAVMAAGHEVALVLTQPDRAAGRGMAMQASPVKRLAVERGVPVLQPERLRADEALRAEMERLAPDAIAVVAYGRLVPAWMLALPRFGCINVHGSLLPKYRGAAPVQWAVAHGDRTTGVTTMRLNEGLDTGPMLLAQEVPISPTAMAVEVLDLLAEVGADLLVRTLDGLAAGEVQPTEQHHAAATLAPILTRNDGRLDTTRSAQACFDRWRGFYPWPGCFATFRGKNLLLHEVRVAHMAELGEPLEGERDGELVIAGNRLFVVCGGLSALEVLELQMEGKRRMTAGDFVRGYGIKAGERLG